MVLARTSIGYVFFVVLLFYQRWKFAVYVPDTDSAQRRQLFW